MRALNVLTMVERLIFQILTKPFSQPQAIWLFEIKQKHEIFDSFTNLFKHLHEFRSQILIILSYDSVMNLLFESIKSLVRYDDWWFNVFKHWPVSKFHILIISPCKKC